MIIKSLKEIFLLGKSSLLRFPLSLIFCFTGTIVAVYFTTLSPALIIKSENLISVIFSCLIGLPFSISVVLFTERKKATTGIKLLSQLILLAFVILFWMLQPNPLYLRDYITYFILFITGIILISFIYFFGKQQVNGFWQFNKTLFFRLFISILYSIVLYIGIVLAMLAIDNLFNYPIPDKSYLRLWIIIVGIVSTWLFLPGIPEDPESLEEDYSFPKGLKVFTQYILLPLLIIYFLILYSYSVKILLLWSLPYGWVSYLVLGYSFLGVFSLLLLHPISCKVENRWIKRITRLFYFSLFPLILLLLIAIKTRISEYGWTENRYYVFVLAIWLTFISIYLLINRIKNIRVIPLSLFILSFFTIFGPVNAFRISVHSQMSRFDKIISKYHYLKNGKIQKSFVDISFEDNKSICSILDYVCEVHGYDPFKPYFKQDLDSLLKKEQAGRPEKISNLIGIKYISRWQRERTDHSKSFSYSSNFNESKKGISISGFQYVFEAKFEKFDTKDVKSVQEIEFKIGDTAIHLLYRSIDRRIDIKIHDSLKISFDTKSFLKKLYEKNESKDGIMDPGDMLLTERSEDLEAMVFFESIEGSLKPSIKPDPVPEGFQCLVFLKYNNK